MSSTLPEGDVIVSNATEPTTAMLIVKWAYPFLENLSYCAAATISPQQAGQYPSPRTLRQFSADSALTLYCLSNRKLFRRRHIFTKNQRQLFLGRCRNLLRVRQNGMSQCRPTLARARPRHRC